MGGMGAQLRMRSPVVGKTASRSVLVLVGIIPPGSAERVSRIPPDFETLVMVLILPEIAVFVVLIVLTVLQGL